MNHLTGLADMKKMENIERAGEIILFTTDDGRVQLDVKIENGTVWLTQQQIGQLYGKAASTINEHIQNIFKEGEQPREACEKKFGNSEFQQKAPFHYNLDLILAVGYRVKSQNGTRFRPAGPRQSSRRIPQISGKNPQPR